METVRVVCAHDCPDMCSLLARVENGRVVRIDGDPDQPFTAGFACAKVNRDAELVHSPERLTTPLRRVGAKGKGEFAAISWDQALDRIARLMKDDRDKNFIAKNADGTAVNRWLSTGFLAASATTNETAWLTYKVVRSAGMLVFDNQARV